MIGIVLVLGELSSKGLGASDSARITRELSVAGLTLQPDWVRQHRGQLRVLTPF